MVELQEIIKNTEKSWLGNFKSEHEISDESQSFIIFGVCFFLPLGLNSFKSHSWYFDEATILLFIIKT